MESYVCNTQFLPAGVQARAPSRGFPFEKWPGVGKGRLGLAGCWHVGHQNAASTQVSITLQSAVLPPHTHLLCTVRVRAVMLVVSSSVRPTDCRLQAPLSVGFSRQGCWVGCMPSSRGSSQPGDWTHVFYVSCICRWVLYHTCQSQTWFFWLNIFQCKTRGCPRGRGLHCRSC